MALVAVACLAVLGHFSRRQGPLAATSPEPRPDDPELLTRLTVAACISCGARTSRR